MNTVDKVQPGQRWEFDESVTAAFDDMLKRSIPQYDVMRSSCVELASQFVQRGTDVVDLGCARGEAMAELIRRRGAHNRFVGVEISKPMADVCRQRFAGLIDASVVEIRDDDLRTTYPPVRASVTLAVLTLQFIPIEHRQRLVKAIFDSTLDGGCLIVVEKVLGHTCDIDDVLVEQYQRLKKTNGYSDDDIERKRLALEGVLVPVTARWNRELLVGAGFRQIDCFWRWMNFAGWLAIK
jgi:tRNA (cmo5U34)-methyltransferase